MKLSEYTLTVLKNYASINSGIVLEKGNVIRTIHPDKAIFVEAEIEETIPVESGIYDLNQFLGCVTTMNKPDLVFKDNCIIMSDDSFILEYRTCSTSLILRPGSKSINLTDPDARFNLTSSTLTKILRLASMNHLPNLSVMSRSGELFLHVHDKANDSANVVKTKIDDKHDGDDFTCIFKTEYLYSKIIPDDYFVELKFNAFAKLTSKTNKIVYFIALDTE